MWVDVNERFPTDPARIMYKVKIRAGSFNVSIIESRAFGGLTATGYRFVESDWQTVTHWWEE